MISRVAKAIFIHIPKTGGNSVDHYFLDRGLILANDELWHATAREVKAHLGDWLYDSYYSFSIVRNPWDRMVSQYFWQSATDYSEQIPTEWGNKNISFADFLKSDFAWYGDKQRANGHLLDQAHFILDDDDEPMVNEIIRFENLGPSFTKLAERLKLRHTDLPHLNKSKHGHYTQYYTGELADIVARMWPRDIRVFGYSFGD